LSASRTWGSYDPADTPRQDVAGPGSRLTNTAFVDSAGPIDASSGVTISATPSGSVDDYVATQVLLRPSAGVLADGGTTTQTATGNQPKGGAGARATEYFRLG
jgi:hypothetical protein